MNFAFSSTGIDSRVLLMRNLAQHRAHGGADRPTTQCDSQIGFNLPSVLHRPVHTVRQQPAGIANDNQQQAVHTVAAGPLYASLRI